MIAYLRKYRLKLVCRVHKLNGADDLNSITLLRRAVVCVSRALVLAHFSECIYKIHIKKFGLFGVVYQYDSHTVLPKCAVHKTGQYGRRFWPYIDNEQLKAIYIVLNKTFHLMRIYRMRFQKPFLKKTVYMSAFFSPGVVFHQDFGFSSSI